MSSGYELLTGTAQSLLIKTAITTSITWEFEAESPLVNNGKSLTIVQNQSVVTGAVVSQSDLTVKYVLKDAKGASPINRKVYAITEPEPTSGRWYG